MGERLTEKVFGFTQLKACENDLCKETCEEHECDKCPIQKAIEKLARYEDLEEQGERPTLEMLEQMQKVAKLAYAEHVYAPGDREMFAMIERALGFKLYSWQKSYLITGHYRRIGSTTAECLKRLLFDRVPIDFSERPRNMKESCERDSMFRIYDQLQAAGIRTNPILRSHKEKADYMRERYINEVRFGNSFIDAGLRECRKERESRESKPRFLQCLQIVCKDKKIKYHTHRTKKHVILISSKYKSS